MKRVFVVLVLASALAFVGWSCQKTAVPKDAGEDAGQDAGIPEGWKEYRNEELGFTFQYPENMDVHVEITDINEAPQTFDPDNPWLLTKDDLVKEQEEINSSPVGRDLSSSGNQVTRSYYKKIVALAENVKVARYLGTSQGGGLFASYTFYHQNHRIEIWVSRELPQSVYVDEVSDNTLFNQLLEQINQGEASEEIQNFFNTFDQSIATFKIID